jgi:hypothetical protein
MTYHHNITEILLEMALKTLTLTLVYYSITPPQALLKFTHSRIFVENYEA